MLSLKFRIIIITILTFVELKNLLGVLLYLYFYSFVCTDLSKTNVPCDKDI